MAGTLWDTIKSLSLCPASGYPTPPSHPARTVLNFVSPAVNNHGLKAPEPDAIKLRDVLTSIGILATSIKMLTGRTATRQNIIWNLENIADNRQIVEGAPILIYYAGHATCQIEIIPGADQRHQFYQLDRCQVEYIVPVDTSSQVPPIPDITISSLLGRIARKKSNHID
ncbi:hypothetical protein FRC07_014954 [Ceratobasidium sp. 392]|nr:hypothetical protein FRC07_014954 [Ceratobasidium sp. 392]